MKYSIAAKFIAIVLCAACLAVSAVGAVGVGLCWSRDLYSQTPQEWQEGIMDQTGFCIAHNQAEIYSIRHLSNCPPEVREFLVERFDQFSYDVRDWSVTLALDGVIVSEADHIPENTLTLEYTFTCLYPTVVEEYNEAYDSIADVYYDEIWLVDDATGEPYDVCLLYRDTPEFTVTVYLEPYFSSSYNFALSQFLHNHRYDFMIALVIGLLVFAVTLVFLCCAAGRHPGKDQVYPVALNRIPLDLHLAATTGICILGVYTVNELLDILTYDGSLGLLSLICLTGFAMALTVVAFLFACAAQMKTPGGFWWRRTVLGFLAVRVWRGMKWLGRGVRAVVRMLPLIWQWLGAIVLMIVLPVCFFLAAMAAWYDFWNALWAILFFTSLAADIALIVHWAWSMGRLLKGVTIMSQGDLHHQIPTQHLLGKFRDFGQAINSMAGAARIAAERQLKSERMKTELITNVSHDIKTPLTSIINYVDLLKQPHNEEQGAQYLDVLDRQSMRLKKLIEDLMEMSKASTGNMAVELTTMDAVEAINQALGEFSDKLTAAGLEPLFRAPQDPVLIRADGRLLWRVMSNLLGNTVKYAMPGTRLYLDLLVIQDNAILNMKNISRDQLNVASDELLERFVRGDASRNTEGSGLGLNIAKSLVELQGGQMHLMVDGDLFKVTLVMPLAREE